MKRKILTVLIAGVSFITLANGIKKHDGEPVDLSVGIIDPETPMGPGHPKSPVEPPYVTLDDHTLYIWSQHSGYALTLLDDNDTVVYQSYVAPGVQYAVLPSTLSGSFTLILSDDTYLYTGVIDLE